MCRSNKNTYKKKKRDVEIHKQIGDYEEQDYDYYVTIHVKQDWFDNRKITLLD